MQLGPIVTNHKAAIKKRKGLFVGTKQQLGNARPSFLRQKMGLMAEQIRVHAPLTNELAIGFEADQSARKTNLDTVRKMT